MNSNYILSLFEKDNFLENKEDVEQVKIFLREFHYATKYLSQNLKVRPFIMYLLLFKKAYFVEGNRNISARLSELGKNLLSDIGKPMSQAVVKRGIDELVRKGYVKKYTGKTGEVNRYEIEFPSEIREVKELIDKDNNSESNKIEEDFVDYYSNQEKRLSILDRDSYKCSYCLKEISRDEFHLDHIYPLSKGGFNYRTNLLSSCKSCNVKKNNKSVDDFLLNNYRNGLLLQEEYLRQRDKIKKLNNRYKEITSIGNKKNEKYKL
jgi:5-methylcytosine-specific restriction endonuclease McrA